VAANYELRLITMCAENRKFSGLDGGEENARGRSRQLAPDFGTQIIQSEWDCYYPDARLSMHIISPGFQRSSATVVAVGLCEF